MALILSRKQLVDLLFAASSELETGVEFTLCDPINRTRILSSNLADVSAAILKAAKGTIVPFLRERSGVQKRSALLAGGYIGEASRS